MKFNKLTGSVLAGATLLSLLAPATVSAATENGNAAANGGTALPQTDNTKVGISFGDNTHNSNTGYLRLQMVPHILDFGNHTLLDAAYPTFTADGMNEGKKDNTRYPNYENGDTNKTAVLNTKGDAALSSVDGKAWATVVDKQITRTAAETDAKNTAASGDWTLSVKSNNELTAVDSQGNAMPNDSISDATLSFKNTASAQTQDVYGLTQEGQDKTWTADVAGLTGAETPAAVSTVTPNIGLTLAKTAGTDVTVATAKAAEGQGANVFGWNTNDIKLTMPKTASVDNAVYQADLTWTLSSTVA
ncbi:WxL domain-containing protein [Dellaglioa algida]|uniref:WxL domain-containing protein n=1 Tax=Dellaglioa algida TaxID=105612 RepID=UPI0024C4BBF7|nr:WxL domain-containing protein [Dellaglioa algida]MDK1726778.1 WxL domain-containing protein [Dellaglioa algida]